MILIDWESKPIFWVKFYTSTLLHPDLSGKEFLKVCFFLKTLQKLMNLVIYSNKMRYLTRLKEWKISRTWFYRFCLYEIFAKKQAGYNLLRGRLKDFWQKRRGDLTTSERKVFRDFFKLNIFENNEKNALYRPLKCKIRFLWNYRLNLIHYEVGESRGESSFKSNISCHCNYTL